MRCRCATFACINVMAAKIPDDIRVQLFIFNFDFIIRQAVQLIILPVLVVVPGRFSFADAVQFGARVE